MFYLCSFLFFLFLFFLLFFFPPLFLFITHTKIELIDTIKRYKYCVNGKSFNNPALFRWVFLGIYQSVAVFFFPYFATRYILQNGQDVGMWGEGMRIRAKERDGEKGEKEK
jgi:magnesium-transporting ATPase (P-type)